MRLIDADELEYTRVRIFHGLNEDGTPCVGGWNAVLMSCAIKDAPTVDAVPVVRCKDCIYQNKLKVTGGVLCDHKKGLMSTKLKDDDFCSYGVRRATDEENQ